MLKQFRISNFKSIWNEPVLLGNFNALIGANAAGKSNFVDALRFVHDVMNDGVSSAVGKRLGWENVLTRGKDKREMIATEIQYDLSDMGTKVRFGKKSYSPLACEYKLEVGCIRKRFYLNSEILNDQFKYRDTVEKEELERSRRRVQIRNSISLGKRPRSLNVPRQLEDSPFLQAGFFCLGSAILFDIISDWRFYDLDVNAARRPCIDEGENVLLSDGHNLAAILDKLRTSSTSSSRAARNRVLQLMSILIPSFDSWKIERQFDGSLGFKINEKGIKEGLLPKMVSDGTIRLLSIFVALLYQPSRVALICIDEPERYLHPQVFEPLVEIMREVSKTTQIIVTTHSTELVKYLQPSEVLMVDKINNVTHIMRAQDVSMIDKFLEEFTLDELWLGGYLEGGKVL